MKKYIIPFMAAFALVACGEDKNDDTQEPQQPTAPNAQTPAPSGVAAVFVALNVTSTVNAPVIGPVVVQQGLPVASIVDGSSVGAVSCEGTTLNNRGSGSYIYTLSATDTEGINYSRPVEWDVEGGSTINAFTYNHSVDVPEVAGISGDSDGNVDLSTNFTLTYNSTQSDLGSADSLYFMLYDAQGEYLMKKTSASAGGATFTAGEMSQLAAGFGYMQVNAFTYTITNQGGSDIAFVAQGSSTKQVELQ